MTDNLTKTRSLEGDSPKVLPGDELRRSEERMRMLLCALPDRIFRLDGEGMVLEYHPPTPDPLAVPPDRFLGRRLSDFLPEEIARESLRHIQETLRGGEDNPVQEVRLSVGGRLSDFETRFARCGTDEVIAIVRDITARKHAEEATRRSEDHLYRVRKYEAIARLTGGMAHHLNNLMTVVTGYSELLLTRTPETDPRHDEIMKIRTAGERATDLTGELLAFSRRQILQPQSIEINRFLAGLSTALRDLAGPAVRFLFLPGEDAGETRVDPDHLRRSLTHLVALARMAMPGGGEIRVATSMVEQVEPIEGVEPARGRYALLSVQDSGCGMDAETRDRIFEPFISWKPGSEGLGLSSVYGFVKQSGGYICVDSRPGGGTTFRIYFPRLDRAADSVAPDRNPFVPTPGAE